jgi:hypothetical protein
MRNILDIGITGSRNGGNDQQYSALTRLLSYDYGTAEKRLHHGCCIGVDEFAALTAKDVGYYIVGHPPYHPFTISDASINESDLVEAPKPYLDRNRDIVHVSTLLIAVPESDHEVLRSGTWSTIRYARKLNKLIFIIDTDGRIQVE